MIQKIRRKLVWGYTLAIIGIMVISAIVRIMALNYYITTAMHKSLIPELEAEIVESRPTLQNWLHGIDREPEIIHFDSYELAFMVMEYWFSPNGELVMAEGTKDISEVLLELIKDWDYPNLKIGEVEFIDDGDKKWHFIILSDDVYNDDGVLIGKVVVGTNMTPLMKITRQSFITALIGIVLVSIIAYLVGNYFAIKAIKPIEVSMQKQRDFVADASHELRTPLSVLLASVDMLEPDNTEEIQTVSYMRMEIINMRNLVNSLLTLARNEKDIFCRTDFDLCEVAANTVKGLQSLANTKNIKIIYNQCAPKIIMTGDEGKVRQLFNILLDNAIKYSAENVVVILEISSKNHQVKICVQDYGIGIAPEDLSNIFERFYRTDKSRSRSQGGFGLGLSIASHIVAVHKGEISVESIPGKGSIFTVNLPLNKPA